MYQEDERQLLSRRDFLRLGAVAGGLGVLAAVGAPFSGPDSAQGEAPAQGDTAGGVRGSEAPAATPTVDVGPYGLATSTELLNPALTDQQLKDELTKRKEAGFHAIRLDFESVRIETNTGDDFTAYDRIVNTAKSMDMGVLATVTQWGVKGQQYEDIFKTPEAYAAFAKKLAVKYGTDITMEAGNEPDIRLFWPTPAGPNPQEYARYLKAFFEAVKGVNQDIQIVSAGITPGNSSQHPRDWLAAMYDTSKGRYLFDCFGYHLYSQPNAPSFATVDLLKSDMAAKGDPRDIIVSEVGWPATNETVNNPEIVTLDQQADYIRRVYEGVQDPAHTIRRAFLHKWKDRPRDPNNPDSPEPLFGILNALGTPKPALPTVDALSQAWDTAHETATPNPDGTATATASPTAESTSTPIFTSTPSSTPEATQTALPSTTAESTITPVRTPASTPASNTIFLPIISRYAAG